MIDVPSKFRIRRIFKPFVVKIARSLAKKGMTPNNATIVMLLSSIGVFLYLVFVPLNWVTIAIYGGIVFSIGIFDGIDGSIARITNTSSKFGGILDSSLDRISDALIFFAPAARELFKNDMIDASVLKLSFLWIVPIWFWTICLVIGAFMTSYIRARATLADKRADTDVGLLGRSERLIIIVILAILNLIPLAIVILAFLANGTAIYRLIKARNSLSKQIPD